MAKKNNSRLRSNHGSISDIDFSRSISTEDIWEKFYKNVIGIDVETRSSATHKGDIFNIGLSHPRGGAFEINILQDKGFTPSSLQYFHQQNNRMAPYLRGEIQGIPALDLTKNAKWHKVTDEYGTKYTRTVMNKGRAQAYLNRTLRNNNYNIVGHNLNFERRKFAEWGLKNIVDGSSEYHALIKQNRLERRKEISLFKQGKLTAAEIREADIARQMKIYELQIKEGLAGKAVVDTQEIAKSLVAIAQKKGLIKHKGSIALGSNVELLAETLLKDVREAHRGVQDVVVQNKILPLMISYIEEIKEGKVPKGLSKWIQRWENPEKIKITSTTKAIEQAIENIHAKSSHTMKSGRINASSYNEVREILTQTGKYKPALITQGERISEFSIDAEKIFEEAEKGISSHHKTLLNEIRQREKQIFSTLDDIGRDGATFASRLPHGLGKAVLAAGAVATGVYLLDKTLGISGKDDDYNTIEGLKHKGFGARRRRYSDFGSGYIANTSYFMRNPVIAKAIAMDEKYRANKDVKKPADLEKHELLKIKNIEDFEALNPKRKRKLREIDLTDYEVKIEDADTVQLWNKTDPEKSIVIRVAGIDAPEIKHTDKLNGTNRWRQQQPFGNKATERLAELIKSAGNDLRIIVDPSERTYGRYVGVLFDKEKNINLQLVKEGEVSSLEFGSASRDMVSREVFSSAGAKAEKERKGIWKDSFFQNWLSFSKGAGHDITFNTLTSIDRLKQNPFLRKGTRLIWGKEERPEESYRYGKLYSIYNQFSGKDDSYNSLEALPHGWFGLQRKNNTNFGSGYRGPVTTEDYKDPTPVRFAPLLGLGIAGTTLYKTWNKEVKFFNKTFDINNFSYIGATAKELGRTNATVSDFVYNFIRRAEYGLGGLPKAFSISTVMSPNIYRDAEITVDLTKAKKSSPLNISRKGYSEKTHFWYDKYLMELTGKNKEEISKYTSVKFKQGKLYGVINNEAEEVILEHAGVLKRIHDKNITTSVSQFSKSYESILHSGGVGAEHEFLFIGGQSKVGSALRTTHAYAHESFAKYLRLMNDPVKAIRDFIPNTDSKILNFAENITKKIPSLGVVGGERGLVGTLPELTMRHFKTLAPWVVGGTIAFSAINSVVKSIAPEDTVAEKAGLLGIGAEGARLTHMAYAKLSDASGMTHLYKEANEQAPGLVGVTPWLGFTLSGLVTGTFAGMMSGIASEASAEKGAKRYAAMIAAKTEKEGLKGLGKLPGLTGEYTKAIRWGLKGAIISGVLALPFLLAGLGSSKSAEELNEEYLEGKEVAVRKARWWEFGTTPWSGGKIKYFRPNWYNRLLSNYKDISLYGTDKTNIIERGAKSFVDPYWLEKKHYEDRPYPIAGPSGEGYGLFGTLYELTLGRVLKPPRYMHEGEWGNGKRSNNEHLGPISEELGGEGRQKAISPYSMQHHAKQQYYSTYEALGLRGFVASAIKEAITGEQDLDEYTPVLQSSSDMESVRRAFWDQNLGGLGGITEPYRRLNPKRPYTTQYVNPIKNKMPSWMPGKNYFINFKTGDPYTKVEEGEYRLPGEGFATRYKELKGVNPENYPLIFRYKILADVAPYSREFRKVRKQLEEKTPTEKELKIFLETEEQLKERRKKQEFRSDKYQETAFGRYGAALVDLYTSNPLEQLTPIAPAHKFLPPITAVQKYEESIYGKDFKLWQRPFEDFIRPAVNVTLNNLGFSEIPKPVAERRKIEEYFDQLKYVKFKRLEEEAERQGKKGAAEKYAKKASQTMTGMDIYASPTKTLRNIPKREKAFFLEFLKAKDENREKIKKMVSGRMKEFYEAQWDKETIRELESGKIKVTKEEKEEIEKRLYNRMMRVQAERTARAKALEKSENLPNEDWIGWREDVDLEDVKLKYLIMTGRDYHSYDLWNQRVRKLGREPYLEEAAEEIDPLNFEPKKISYEEMLDIAVKNGIKNPEIIMSMGGEDVSYDLEYKKDEEIKEYLRELGQVV